MFGIYRFILALMVILAHLASPVTNWTGVYAVFCFYLLSGYLMTLVLNKRYGFNFDGLRRYAVNWILRIYPPYLVVLVVSIIIVATIPSFAISFNPALSMPSNLVEWRHNLFIFGLNGDFKRLIPTAWSVDVELFFYCAMGLLLARNKVICIGWFLFSLVITILMTIAEKSLGLRYQSLIGASLPFSIGSMMYYFRDKLPILSRKQVLIASTLFLLYAVFSKLLWTNPRNMGFYISLILGIYLQISLMHIKKENIPSWLINLDKRLGDFSYPIFLCHWQIASIVAFVAIPNKGMSLFVIGSFASVLFAVAINQFIEKPIEKIRNSYRKPTG